MRSVQFTAEEEQWRSEVREFLDAELPESMEEHTEFFEDPDYWDFAVEFTKKVARLGWIGLTWPKEYGGLERSLAEQLILFEEFDYREAPLMNFIGWNLVAPALLRAGTEDQRQRFIPPIARMEKFWAEGYSEPDAGSDLASLTTRADWDGTDWVVNGQKTFMTWASHADCIFLLCRTSQDLPRHKGLSVFCVDFALEGVSQSPLYNIAGGRQGLVYLDNVRVSQDMLLGELNNGWDLTMGGFYGASIRADYALYQRRLDKLTDYCISHQRGGQFLIDDITVREYLAEMSLLVESQRLLTYEQLSEATAKEVGGIGRVMSGVYHKEAMPRFAELTNLIVGPLGVLSTGSAWAPLGDAAGGGPEAWFRQAHAQHAGGTPQLRRMILATRGLGLPRS